MIIWICFVSVVDLFAVSAFLNFVSIFYQHFMINWELGFRQLLLTHELVLLVGAKKCLHPEIYLKKI